MKVFISWSGADREVKNAIVAKFKQEGIDYFDSDEQCLSAFSGACIEGVRSCQVFVVIISPASMSSKSLVINEVIEAHRLEGLNKLNMMVYSITDEPLTPEFAMHLNHITDTNHIARLNKMGSLASLDLLAYRVKELFKLRAEGRPELPMDTSRPKVAGVKIDANFDGYFVADSRNDVIADIQQAFEKSNVVVLTGTFGFGKKTVARKYVSTCNYQSAVEVNGFHQSLYDFMLNTLAFVNIHQDAINSSNNDVIIQKKCQHLGKLTHNDIIVITDLELDEMADDMVLRLFKSLSCHVIITTQKIADIYADYLPVIGVGPMSTNHLVELFFHHYDRTGKMDHAPLMDAVVEFFDDIGGHTKTVEIAALELALRMKSRPEEVIKYLNVKSNKKSSLNERIVDKLSRLIGMNQFSIDEQQILLCVALLATPTISKDALVDFLEGVDPFENASFINLIDNGWITANLYDASLFIEPVIARVFVSKFMDYSIATKCFVYLVKKFADTNTYSLIRYYSTLEHFAQLLNLDKVVDVLHFARMRLVNASTPVQSADAINSYTTWYNNVEEFGAMPTEQQYLTKFVVVCVNAIVMPSLRSIDFLTTNNATSERFYPSLGDTVAMDMESVENNPLFADVLESVEFDEICQLFDDEDNLTDETLIDIFDDIYEAFCNTDEFELANGLSRLIDELESSPEKLMDATVANQSIQAVIQMSGVFAYRGKFNACSALLERLVNLDGWSDNHLYDLLLLLAQCNFAQGNMDEFCSLMQSADDLLGKMLSSGDLTDNNLRDTQDTHLCLYTSALVLMGDVDQAIAKFSQRKELGINSVGDVCISAIIAIVSTLQQTARMDDLIAFVQDNKSILQQYIKNAPAQSELLQFVQNLMESVDNE